MDFCRGPVPFFGQRSNNSVRMISPTTVGFPLRRLWILSLLVILLSSVTVASSFSLTNTFHRLLQDADDELQARELTLQYCGDAIEQGGDNNEKTKSAFSKYIYRGDPVSNILLYGLTSLGGDQWKDILLESKNIERTSDEKFVFPDDLGTTLSIVYIVFICIALILLIIACVMFPTCCSSCWRNCFGKCFCRKCCHDRERVRPIQEVSKKKRRLLLGGSLAGVTFFIIFACLAIAFSTKFAWSIPGAVCQVTRLSVEAKDGVLYTQHPGESSWMKGLTDGAAFRGFGAATQFVDDVDAGFVQPGNVLETLESKINQSADDINTNMVETQAALEKIKNDYVPPTNPQNQPFIFRPSYEAIAYDDGSGETPGEALSQLIEEGKTQVDKARDQAISAIDGVDLNDAVQKTRDGVNDIEAEVDNYRSDFTEIMNDNEPLVTYLSTLGFLPFLVISILSVVGIIFIVIMIVQLRGYYKDGTEPNHKTFSNTFGFFWGWFAITSILFFVLGFTVLMALSVSDSGCEVFKDAANDPSSLQQYEIFHDVYNEDPDSSVRKALDTCFANNGDGDLITAFAGSQLEDARKSLSDGRQQFIGGVEGQPEGREEYEPLLNNLETFGGSPMMNIPAIKAAAAVEPNMNRLLFLRNEILFSGDRQFAGEINTADSIFTALMDHQSQIANAAIKEAGFDTWLNDPATRDCVRPVEASPKTFYSMKEHLNVLKEQSTELSCGIDYTFCIRWKSGAQTCSDIGDQQHELYLNEIEGMDLTKPPQWHDSQFDLNLGSISSTTNPSGSLDYQQLQQCMTNALLQINNELIKPHCETYWVNNLAAGIFFAFFKVENHDTNADNNVNTVAEMLMRFDRDIQPAVLQADQSFTKGEEILDSAGDGLNCKAMAYSVGSVIDGFCGGVQQDLFWIALCWCLMACVSFFFWVICYKLFHYFKDRAIEEKIEDEIIEKQKKRYRPSILLFSAKAGDSVEVEKQVEHLDPRDVADDKCNTSLHFAAYSGDPGTVRKLLDKNAAIEEVNDFGYTPLSIAASEGHADVVSLLVQRGADPTIQDEFGETALHAAARSGDLPVVEALCQDCAPAPTYLNDEGVVAADTAYQSGHYDVENFIDSHTPRRLTDRKHASLTRGTAAPSFDLSPFTAALTQHTSSHNRILQNH